MSPPLLFSFEASHSPGQSATFQIIISKKSNASGEPKIKILRPVDALSRNPINIKVVYVIFVLPQKIYIFLLSEVSRQLPRRGLTGGQIIVTNVARGEWQYDTTPRRHDHHQKHQILPYGRNHHITNARCIRALTKTFLRCDQITVRAW